MAPAMHLLWALLIHLTGVMAAPVLNQSPISDPVSAGQTARLQCAMENGAVGSKTVEWFRHRPGEAPVYLIYHKHDGTIYRGSGFTDRFQSSRDASGNSYILTNGTLVPGDSAVYCCAVWDTGYFFGPGTALSVKSSENRSPSVLLLPPSSDEIGSGSATLSCLVSRFKPGLVRLRWSVDGQETDSGVTTGAVSPESDQTYSLSSYLRVPAAAWNKGSSYFCSVSHGSLSSPLLKTINASSCSD